MMGIGYRKQKLRLGKGKVLAVAAVAATAALAATMAAPTPAYAELVAIRVGDQVITPGEPKAGTGWDYDGGETLTLDGYEGGFVEVTGSASIVIAGDSSITADNKAIFSSNEHLDVTGKNGATLTCTVNGGAAYPDASAIFGSTGIDVTDLNLVAEVNSANPVANVSIVGSDSGDVKVADCSISGTASGSANTYGIAMAEENGRGDISVTDSTLDISTVATSDSDLARAAAIRGTSALITGTTATLNAQAEGPSATAAGIYSIAADAEIRDSSVDSDVDATASSGDSRAGALMSPISGIVGGGSTLVNNSSAVSTYGEANAGAIVSTVGLDASDGLTAHVNSSTLNSTAEATSNSGRASSGAAVDAQGVSVVGGSKVNSAAVSTGGSSDSVAVGLGALAGNALIEGSTVTASGSNPGQGWAYGIASGDQTKMTNSKVDTEAANSAFRSMGIFGKSSVTATSSTVNAVGDLVGVASGPENITLQDCKAISPENAVSVPLSISSDDVTVEGYTLAVGIDSAVFDAQSSTATVTSGVAADVTIDQEGAESVAPVDPDNPNPGSTDGTYPDSDGYTVLPATDDPFTAKLVVVFGMLFAGAISALGLSVVAKRS